MEPYQHKILENGSKARHLLENDIFNLAARNCENSLIERWKSCQSIPERDEIWRQLQALYSFLTSIQEFLGTAELELANIEQNNLYKQLDEQDY